MADRATLHHSKLEEFAAWAAADGWTREPTKGEYEALRLSKPGRPPVIVYRRDRGDHLTTTDNSPGGGLVRQYIRSRRRRAS